MLANGEKGLSAYVYRQVAMVRCLNSRTSDPLSSKSDLLDDLGQLSSPE